MSNLVDRYRGWKITYDSKRPVTGTHVGEQYGVEVCAGDLSAVRRIIDQRILDEKTRKKGNGRQ